MKLTGKYNNGNGMPSTTSPARVAGKSRRVGAPEPQGQNNPAPTAVKDRRMGAGSRKVRRNGGPA